jgi:hypothetical protein
MHRWIILIAAALFLTACGSANTSAFYYASLMSTPPGTSLAAANRLALQNADRGPSYYGYSATPAAEATEEEAAEEAEEEVSEEAEYTEEEYSEEEYSEEEASEEEYTEE